MFGSWGGMILQVTITLVVVLVLIAAVYWLVRRYSSGGLGRIGRGRVPRLAVIDAMAVDGRRRLVLVRRDNIEHLLLIGGPSDIVVEQAIQRPRRPVGARPQQSSAPPPPAANEPSPFDMTPPSESPPIPFPQTRSFQQSASPPAPPPFRPDPVTMAPPAQAAPPQPQPIERPFPPVRRPATPPPTPSAPAARNEPPPAPPPAAIAPTIVQFEPMSDTAPAFPDMPQAPTYEESIGGSRRGAALNGHGAESEPELDPFAPPHSAADDTAAKVNDLEREMARLLGEITAKRP
jgi:flagellar biogenesis protein FliO